MIERQLLDDESSWMLVWNGSDYEVIENFNSDDELDDDFEKASFGGNRSAAGQYAARVRWGSRSDTMLYAPKPFDPLTVKEKSSHALEQELDGYYPHRDDEDYPFTKTDRDTVTQYTEVGETINTELRNFAANPDAYDNPQAKAWVDNATKVDKVFEKVEPLEKPIVLHRGLDISRRPEALAFFGNLKVGQSFSDPAYFSTSISSKVGTDFAFDSRIRLKVVVPAGKKVLPVNTLLGKRHGYALEHEALLPRGSKFKVVQIVKENFDAVGEGTTIKVVLQ